MSKSFNGLERWLGQRLESFPRLRQAAKTAYQRLGYLVSRTTEPLSLHPAVCGAGLPETREHFFGYFDKSCWSPDQRYVAYHRAVDRHEVEICVHDLDNGQTRAIARTASWNWQQGAMTTWLDCHRVIHNAIEDRRYVALIRDITTGAVEQTCRFPVQCVSPDGRTAMSLNYRRLARLRPDYGYFADVDNFQQKMSDEEDGFWRVDLSSGEGDLVLSLADLKNQQPRPEMRDADHKVNHAVFSPDGTRVLFMHRWITRKGKWSRLYSMAPDGSDLFLLADDRMVSHYSWRDSATIVAWARLEGQGDHYFLLTDRGDDAQILSPGQIDVHGDGHPSFSPDGRWFVTDTYPGRDRCRTLLLLDVLGNRLFTLGRFFSPWKYDGTSRCDLHPRWAPDGKWIAIDSVHAGYRGLYRIDVSRLVSG